MNLNSNIILGGQQPDIVNTLARSTRAAGLANQVQRQNQLAQINQQHGAGILSGDQNALNALAAADPRQAMQMQQVHRDNARQDQMDALQRQKFDLALQDFARRASAEEKAAAAAELERDITRAGTFYQAGDLDGLNRALVEAGEEPVQSLDQFPVIAGLYGDALSVLKSAQALTEEDKPADAYERYVQRALAEGREPMNEFEYADAMRGNGVTVTNADGSSVRVGGSRSGGKPPSERQSTLRLFGGLMNETMPAINALEDDPNFNPVSPRSAAAGSGVAGNVVTSTEARQYESLKRQWAEGVLRIQTGAAATQPEIERVMATYFPVFGDDPAAIALKRQQRDAFARSLTEASGGTITAPGGADTRSAIGETGAAQEGIPDFKAMTDEELDAWIAENGQ